jgi:hypothetical protein
MFLLGENKWRMCRIGFGPKSGMGNWGAGEGERMSRCRWTARDRSGDINLCHGKENKEGGKKGDGGGEEERKGKKEIR